MTDSRMLRLKRVAAAEQETPIPAINDNVPGIVPGHAMSELENVPRSPAGEPVLHYARISQIGSFPDCPAADGPAAEGPVSDAALKLDVPDERRAAAAASGGTRVTLASLLSGIVHIMVFSFFAFAMVAVPEEPVEEAGAVVSVTMLGDAEFDAMAAGEPELVVAEETQAETLQPAETQPTETTPVEPVETVTAETAQPQPITPTEVAPAEAVPVETAVPAQSEIVQSEPVAALEPEVMTSAVPAEPTVVQPVATLQPETVDTVDPMAVTPVAPVETITPVEEKPVAQQPVEKKPVQKPKPVAEKPKKKITKPKAGSAGQAEQDQKKGSSDGSEAASVATNGSKSAGRTSSSGSAAVANYPGKVQSRIRRSVRVPSAFKRSGVSVSVRVRLTIGASGSLSQVSVARSSGVPELDQAVVDGVRRAAPFPPLPPEWGKPSWSFTQEVQVSSR